MEKSTTSVVNAKKVKNKKNKRLTLGQFVDRLSAVMRPYVVYDGNGECRVFDVSHRGLENAIEYANQIGSAVLREAANGSGDEIIWNPLEQPRLATYSGRSEIDNRELDAYGELI